MSISRWEKDNLPRWHPGRTPFFEWYSFCWNDPSGQTAAEIHLRFLASLRREPTALITVFSSKAQNIVVRKEIPLSDVRIEHDLFYIALAQSTFFHGGTRGEIENADHRLQWDLAFEEINFPLKLLPEPLYSLPFPSVKRLSPQLAAPVKGVFVVDGEETLLESASGHQSHGWGGQQEATWVHAHGRNEKESLYFEGYASGKTILFFLSHQGKSYSFLSPWHWRSNKSVYDTHRWRFEGENREVRLVGEIQAKPQTMTGVSSEDPDGSVRYLHKSLTADLRIQIFQKKSRGVETLTAPASTSLEVGSMTRDPRVT